MHALLAIALLVPPILGGWLVASRHGAGARTGFAIALLAWQAWAVLVSEVLSLGGGALRGWTLGLAWAAPAVLGIVIIARSRVGLAELPRQIREAWQRAALLERLAGLFVAMCGALIFAVGFISAPNNWDSMSYHLTRVARWTDLHQIVHYPTAVDPQLYQPPGAEIGILQWYVLADGDRFAFVGQWLAWVAVVLLASRVAQLLGASRAACWAATLLTATIPMAILQGSSTQNDLTLAMWLSLATVLALRVGREARALARPDVTALLLAAGALGMAVLTKGTGAMLGVPVGVLLLVVAARRFGVVRGVGIALIGAVLIAIPSLGAWHRNIDTFDSPFATGLHGKAYQVQHPTPGSVASNVIRNATNHMDLPGHAWNDAVERGAERLDRAIGQDPNDPATTFESQPFRVGPYGPHEDHAGSFLLLLLAQLTLAAMLIGLVRRPRRVDLGWQAALLGIVIAQVLLFATFVTWQNWHARLHLPILVLFVPVVAAVLDTRGWRWLLAAAVAVSVATAPIPLFGNVTRPLIGENSILTHSRTHDLFVPRPQLEAPYAEVMRKLRAAHVREAGIVSNVDEWQYPLFWLGRRSDEHVRFRDVSTDPAHAPAFVVCLTCTAQTQAQLIEAGYSSRPLRAGGLRAGRGADVGQVELYVNPRRSSSQ